MNMTFFSFFLLPSRQGANPGAARIKEIAIGNKNKLLAVNSWSESGF